MWERQSKENNEYSDEKIKKQKKIAEKCLSLNTWAAIAHKYACKATLMVGPLSLVMVTA